MGPLEQLLTEEHGAMDTLLARSVANGFDPGAFEEFRAALLRHIGIEEKILLPDARRRRGGEPLPIARTLRIEHGAIAALLVPTPDAALVKELESLLAQHSPREEGPEGVYAICERLARAELDALVERVRIAPKVPTAPHFDGPGTYRKADDALRASARVREKK